MTYEVRYGASCERKPTFDDARWRADEIAEAIGRTVTVWRDGKIVYRTGTKSDERFA